MSLTWKDAVTTVLLIGTLKLAYARHVSWNSWLAAPRLSFIVAGVLGVAMCALSSPNVGNTPMWTGILATLGVLALTLVLAGVITGSPVLFYVLIADISALWLLTTLRHLVVAP
jgi:hypothetical protein